MISQSPSSSKFCDSVPFDRMESRFPGGHLWSFQGTCKCLVQVHHKCHAVLDVSVGLLPKIIPVSPSTLESAGQLSSGKPSCFYLDHCQQTVSCESSLSIPAGLRGGGLVNLSPQSARLSQRAVTDVAPSPCVRSQDKKGLVDAWHHLPPCAPGTGEKAS